MKSWRQRVEEKPWWLHRSAHHSLLLFTSILIGIALFSWLRHKSFDRDYFFTLRRKTLGGSPRTGTGTASVVAAVVVACWLGSSAVPRVANPSNEGERKVIFTAAQAEEIEKDRNQLLPLTGPFWTPEEAAVVVFEAKLRSYFGSHTVPVHERALVAEVAKRWPAYHLQYLGHTEKGKRLIYLNAFCDRTAPLHRDWRTAYVRVMDGGPCYFQASYDPIRGEMLRVWVNGYA